MSHDTHQSSSTSQTGQGGTWTEPPWSGWIETTGDALLILEAARRGLIPRVTRRLVDSERKMITSGSVFVFDEDESGIKRWTDGFFWSPSRILGNFLLYRETEKRGAGHRSARAERDAQPDVNDQSQYNVDGVKLEGQTLSRPKSEASRLGIDRQRERSLVGSLTNSYKFKPGGMMKKTFSLTIGGVAQHLISYYKIEDVEQGRLRSPSTLPELASLDISPEYLDKTHFRNPPKVEIGVDGIPRYRGEADDIDSSPQLVPAPLSTLPYHDDPSSSSSKRGKRYDPYGTSSSSPKRSRKSKNASASHSQDATHESTPHSYTTPVHQPAPGYGDTSLSSTTTQHYSQYPPYYGSYTLPPVYSPAPYHSSIPPITTGSPLPQQTPSPQEPPQTSPTHSHPSSMPYSAYPSETSHQPQPQAQTSVYSYYPTPSYAPYPWPPAFPAYSPQQTHGHAPQGGSGSGDTDTGREDGEDPAGGT